MYDLLLPKFIHTLQLGPHDGWHSGLPLERLPDGPIQARCGTASPLLLLRASTPLFHRDVIAFLRERGRTTCRRCRWHCTRPPAYCTIGRR